MIKNKLIVLSFITIIVIVTASIFANLRAPQSEKEKLPFFPDLAEKVPYLVLLILKLMLQKQRYLDFIIVLVLKVQK